MNFFKVVIEPQTYINIIYLLLSFPLGTFYFTFLVTMLTTGLSLVIVWIGIPILLLTVAAWWALAVFERYLAENMLNVKLGKMVKRKTNAKKPLKRLKHHFKNPVTWKSLVYLFLKFPLGVFNFVVLVTLLSTSISLTLAPLAYPILNQFVTTSWPYPEAYLVLVFVVGFFLFFVTLHVVNALAKVSAQLAKLLLGN